MALSNHIQHFVFYIRELDFLDKGGQSCEVQFQRNWTSELDFCSEEKSSSLGQRDKWAWCKHKGMG